MEHGVKRAIVVILKGYPRLSETFIAQELLGLERAGFDLRIFSMRYPTDRVSHPVHREVRAPVVYLPEYLYQAPLRVIRSLAKASRQPGFGRAARAWIQDLARDFSPNRFRRFGQAAVLATEMPADAAWLYAHFIHTPSAVTRYASLMTGLPWSCSAHAKDIWTLRHWELQANLAAAEWAVTCTRTGHDRLVSLGSRPADIHLLYHGFDMERFPRVTLAASARDGSDAGDPVRLLAVGRAVEKKGFDMLLEALAQLPHDRHWHLTHIGGGDLLKSLKARANVLGIGERIAWQGAQDQTAVLAAYREADLFVLPCRIARSGDRDGLPNVLVEAESQRLACLSTDVGGVAELIRHSETGLLVPPDQPCALSEAMLGLIADPALRGRLAAAGEARARAHFDQRRGLVQLAGLFERSLGLESEAPQLQAAQ